ncbi:MAG: hypothetical protein HY680_07325 [Chloroflexi bacterium]|nr:hypothetical protein [Chloroflexota bacterium]
MPWRWKQRAGYNALAQPARAPYCYATPMRSLATAFLLLLFLAAVVGHDTLSLTPVQQLAAPYHFNLVVWEAKNLPSKWSYLALTNLFPFRPTSQERLAQVQEYFRLQGQVASVEWSLGRAAATASPEGTALEAQLAGLRRQIARLRPSVEEALESLITSALREEGISPRVGKIAFPPVDFALDPLPTILIISPRDRIERSASHLLVPGIPPSARAVLEEAIASKEDLSALVEDLGGISTYPSIIQSVDLRVALVIGSHEWLHNYLFFYPLGRSYQKDGDMASLNETAANIFGEELGNRIYSRLTGTPEPALQPPGGPSQPCPTDQFCFGREMYETRVRTDELLQEGRIEEAEAYMEERRQLFVANGYSLRKLNQAYFAFHGTYADSPSSVSPIYGQLYQHRLASPSLAAFIHALQDISSYDQFLALLGQGDGGRQAQ